jgi:hypothetical protein
MPGGVGLGSPVFRRPVCLAESRPAFATELLDRRIGRPARSANGGHPGSALATELLANGILVLAPGTLHREASQQV